MVWTNDKSLISESAQKLEIAGVSVREIEEIKEHCTLYDLIQEKIHEKKWGMASDIFRVEVVKHEGGIYMDLNYALVRSLEQEMHKYDYFSQSYGGPFIDNFFFASIPNHPILVEWINNIQKKFSDSPPEYIKKIIESGDVKSMTDYMTANPSCFSYYAASNKGTVDFIFPINCANVSVSNTGAVSIKSVDEDILSNKNDFSRGFCIDNPTLHLFKDMGVEEQDTTCLHGNLVFGADGTNGLTWI